MSSNLTASARVPSNCRISGGLLESTHPRTPPKPNRTRSCQAALRLHRTHRHSPSSRGRSRRDRLQESKLQRAKRRTPFSKAALVVTLGLVGCSQNSLDNQIEKCVQAGVKAAEPYATEKDRAGREAWMRINCLQAASGQKN